VDAAHYLCLSLRHTCSTANKSNELYIWRKNGLTFLKNLKLFGISLICFLYLCFSCDFGRSVFCSTRIFSARLSIFFVVRCLLLGVLSCFFIYCFACAEDYKQLLTGNWGHSFGLLYRLCNFFLIFSLLRLLCSGTWFCRWTRWIVKVLLWVVDGNPTWHIWIIYLREKLYEIVLGCIWLYGEGKDKKIFKWPKLGVTVLKDK